ncbi:MAG: HEAT repeat domain-containing protein, partial [Gammaproteobacteria bacterium]|nr:HEAT repeat domain-containing protein [Gammaproteobacteria bacterium]
MEPYKGLRPYEEQDQNNFFGRDKEKNILIDKILSSKLTLLFAASGVGKSSLLQAAVLPELKNPEVQNLDVVYFKDWVDEPGAALKNAVLGYLQQQRKINTDYRLEPELSLKDAFHRCSLGSSDPLVIVLDQFEEFFNYQRYRSEFKPFIRQLAAAIHDRETATAFVISMREDFALELNAFKPNLSTVLFENFYRLEKLPLEKAKTAIAAPVEHVGFHYEEGLLENLLADLIRREQTDRFGANAAELMNAPSVVEPPHLQIICTQLWEADRNNPHKCLSKATYESKGKAAGLLTNYFKNQVETLSAAEKKLASESFNYLVNKHGTKMAYPLEDLAQLLRADKTALQITLDKLEQARILRRQIRQTNALHLQEKGQDRILWYELYHDIFSKSIYDWNEAYKARQRNKKAAFAVAGVFMGAAVLYTGYDIWVNHYDHHLRLSIKSHVSTGIELYQGKKASLDVLNQQHYLGETDYRRTDLEPDKLFQKAQVENIEKINPEVIGLFPRVERIMGYWEDGEIDKALKLARYTIRGRNRETAAKMVELLARQPSVKALEELGWHLERSQDVHLKKQIIETISLYVPHQAIPFLLLAAKDEHKEVHASAFSALGSLENREALAPLIAFLENPNASMRTNAAKALGQLGYPEAVEPLLPLLENQNSDTRHQAAFALAKLGSTAAVTPFFAMLKDSDAKIRRNTVNAIAQAKFDSSEIVTALVILLKDSEPRVGQAAIDALVQLDTVEALSPLVEMLREPDSNVRESAVRVLIQTNRAEAVKPLLALLEDANLKIRDRAVDVLAQLGRSEAVTPLLERLKNPDSEVRGKAVSKLAELDAVESITSLTALLKDPSAEVRLATVDALGLLGRVEAVEPLMEILNDPYWKVRHNAIAALGKLHGSKAAGLLIRALDDHNGQVRAIAAQALGNMRNVTAAESLLKRLKDTNSKVRKNAAAALVKLGRIKNAKQDSLVRGDAENVRKRPNHSKFVKPPAIVEALVMQLKDRELYARGQVAEALAQLGSDDALKPLITELLIEQVKDKTPYVRQNAAYALSLLKSVKAAGKLIEPPLIELLKDEDPDIREKAVGALGELGSAGAVKFLIKRLKDKDADVRKVAAVMLGKAGNTEAVKPLIELLKDSYFDVVASARTAIVQLNDDNTVKLLTELLKDPDGFVRYDAASALGELNSAKAAKPLVDLLEDYSWSVRNKASSALEKLGGNETLRPLIEKLLIASLENQNSDTRSSAANLLGQLGSEKAIGPLRKLLKDQYSSVRSNAAASLDILGSHRAVQPFVITLQDQDKNIRIRAVKVLTQLNSAEGIGPLIKLLTEMIPADGGNDFFEGASAFHRLYKSKVIQDTRLVGNLMSKWTGITEIFQLRELYKMSLLLARLGYKEKTVRFSLRKLPSSTLLGDWEWRWTSTSVLMEFVNL